MATGVHTDSPPALRRTGRGRWKSSVGLGKQTPRHRGRGWGGELSHHLLKQGGWRQKRQESEGWEVQLLVCPDRGL